MKSAGLFRATLVIFAQPGEGITIRAKANTQGRLWRRSPRLPRAATPRHVTPFVL